MKISSPPPELTWAERLSHGRALLTGAGLMLAFGLAGDIPVLDVLALILLVAALVLNWRQLQPWVPVTRSWFDEQQLSSAAAQITERDEEIARQRQVVAALNNARTKLRNGADPFAAVLEAARVVAGAEVSLYLEDRAGELLALAAEGAEPLPVALGLSALCRRALDTKSTQIATGKEGPTPEASTAVEALSVGADLTLGSVVAMPVQLTADVTGVLVLGLSRPTLEVAEDLSGAVALLAGIALMAAEQQALAAAAVAPVEEAGVEPAIDELTELLDRRAGQLALALEAERATRGATSMSVAVLEVDRFAEFTATRGRAVADELLTKTAAAWSERLHNQDVLARWDEQQFLLILPNCSQADTERAVRQLRSRVPMGQTVSVGFTMHIPTESPDKTLARAQDALRRAKHSGRNRSLAVFAPRRAPESERSTLLHAAG